MEKGKKILVKFLIVLVTLICADNGRSFIFAGNSVQIILSHNHEKSGEETHQHHMFNLSDDEKWINTSNHNFLSQDRAQIAYHFNSDNPSGKYTGSVWQPPKQL